jgi:hypothetical protein
MENELQQEVGLFKAARKVRKKMERGIPSECLQEIIKEKNSESALKRCTEHGYIETWHVLDGCLVIYNHDDPPDWLRIVLEMLGQNTW